MQHTSRCRDAKFTSKMIRKKTKDALRRALSRCKHRVGTLGVARGRKNPTPTRRLTWAASRKKKSNADAKPTTPNLKRNTKKVNNAMRSQTLSRWRARKKNTSILNNPLSRSNMYALSKEMQYTLRCRDVKIRVGALETNRLQENDEKYNILRCRVETASAQARWRIMD